MNQDELRKAIGELEEYIKRDVAAGFRSEEEICTNAADVLADDFNSDHLPLARRLARERIDAHLREQETWPTPTDCDRLDAAFVELEQNGIVARQDFSCCGNCGSLEIWEEMETVSRRGLPVRGYTFYHMQDTNHAIEGHGVYLGFGAVQEGEIPALEIAREIVITLQRHGLAVHWNGSWQTRILVQLVWKRRRQM